MPVLVYLTLGGKRTYSLVRGQIAGLSLCFHAEDLYYVFVDVTKMLISYEKVKWFLPEKTSDSIEVLSTTHDSYFPITGRYIKQNDISILVVITKHAVISV